MIGLEKEQYDPMGLDKEVVDLQKLTESELLLLRSQIDAVLPVTKLSDMNLERELTLQFRVAQALQNEIMDDTHTPANQKAQVMNSVAATLQSLAKMQQEHYTPERLKKIEAALVKVLNTLPAEQTEEFFEVYERMLST